MSKMKQLLFIGMIISVLASCKKKEDIQEPSINEMKSNYLPLSIGNYWVYENVRIDTLGNEILMSNRDSIVVRRDTVIRNKVYYFMERITQNSDWVTLYIVRDSSKNLVTHDGRVLFSEYNFNDVLHTQYLLDNNTDTVYIMNYKMYNPGIQVTVPAGSFSVLDYRGHLKIFDNLSLGYSERILNNYYSPSVGKILETYTYLSQPEIYEKMLVNYHIAN
jgi:hypothetical protein